jgi:mitochondrial-processing peptidase subunit alpha
MSEMCDMIEQVTAEDIWRVSHRVFGEKRSRPPTFVVQGPQNVLNLAEHLHEHGLSGLQS